MAKLFPEILGIEAGQNSALAQKIVERVKSGNPEVVIKPYKAKTPSILNIPKDTPKKSKDKVIWERAKKALIIREKLERSKNGNLRFLHVFVAVGDVVEDYQFTLSMENECPYSCQFCYVQGTLPEKPIPTIFTNIQEDGLLLREIKIALLAMHMHTQTHGVKFNIGWDQQDWVHDLIGVINDAISNEITDKPIQEIFNTHKDVIKANLKTSNRKTLKPILDDIDKYDFVTTTEKFNFNAGEINDALVHDHLTDNSKFLVNLFSSQTMKKDGAVLLFRTKSVNFDNLAGLVPIGNTKVSVTLGPNIFVSGPPSFKERIKGANTLLTRGYKVGINIDPIILTESTFEIYKQILDKIHQLFDYKSENFTNIIFGMLRFGSNNLDNNIRKRHSGLHKHTIENMSKPNGEEKYRYEVSERIDTYKSLIDYTRTLMPDVTIGLSTEPPSVWDKAGLK